MTAPSNRAIASAIAELGQPRLDAAAAYARTCIDLVAAGIPRVELALALDCERPIDTVSMRKVQRWAANPSGCLAMVGPNGCGKSFAAQRMAIERHARGQRTCWLAAVEWDRYDKTAQARWVAAGLSAQLLVVDDLGAGSTGAGGYVQADAESEVERMIVDRMGDGRPTAVLVNGNEESVSRQLGGRIWSRMRRSGGTVYLPEDSEDLREGTEEPPINTLGRWPRWQAAADLLDLVGHDDQGSWHRLIRRCSDGDYMRDVAARLGLNRAEVIEHAKRIPSNERALAAEAARVLRVDVVDYSLDGVLAAIVAKQKREREVTPGARTLGPHPVDVHPSGDDGRRARKLAEPLGFEVVKRRDGFELHHRGRPLSTGWASLDAAWCGALEHIGAADTSQAGAP